MENAPELAKRFREVMLNGQWIAQTNFAQALEGLSWQQATQKVGSLNTIAALTFHVNYYLDGVAHFFETGKLEIRDQYSFDMPEIASQEAWDSLRNTLLTTSEKFAQHVDGMPPEKLDEIFVDEKYGDYHRNIEGLIEHAYYHLGQVSLLRKLVLEGK